MHDELITSMLQAKGLADRQAGSAPVKTPQAVLSSGSMHQQTATPPQSNQASPVLLMTNIAGMILVLAYRSCGSTYTQVIVHWQ